MTAAGAEEECRSTQVMPTLQQSEARLEASDAVLKAEEEKGKAGTKSDHKTFAHYITQHE